MAEYLSPGVYVEEFSSGIKPMEGVLTDTAGFIGMTERGPVRGAPTFVRSFGEYQQIFGGYLPREDYQNRRFLPMAVEQFFANGGSRCFVIRLLDESGSAAAWAGNGALKFIAASNGNWGNRVSILCKPEARAGFWQLNISTGLNSYDYAECISEVTLAPDSDSFLVQALKKSNLVRAEYNTSVQAGDDLCTLISAIPQAAQDESGNWKVTLSGGMDCPEGKKPYETVDAVLLKGDDQAAGGRTGLCALEEAPEVRIVVAPGVTEPDEVQEVIDHCEKMSDRVCILDMPEEENRVTALQDYRKQFSSSFAAMYHPWIQVFEVLEQKPTFMPPSGAVAGVYARCDNTRGVHKAPANEIIRNCTGLQTLFGKPEQDRLNPAGINLIRNIQEHGIRVWGARTLSNDANWKYVNIRRLAIYIEETLRRSIARFASEPNDQPLWSKVRGSVSLFLGSLWRDGILMGATESEAYFVNIGKGSTMTGDDIEKGRLICVVGVAPVRPSEFLVFRITQIMEKNE